LYLYEMVEQRGHRLELSRALRQARQDVNPAGVHATVTQEALAGLSSSTHRQCVRKGAGKKGARRTCRRSGRVPPR
jgi:hypothetical protein